MTYAVRIIYNKFVSDPVGVGLLVPETGASDQQARSAGNMRGMTAPRRRPPQGPLKCSGSRRLHTMMIVTDPQGGSPLHFWHDAATRSVTGPSAARIRATAARWSGVGVIHGMQPVAAPDPLGSDRDMAVMLASLGYVLPESLRRLLPKPGPNPTGAVVNPGAHNPAPIGLGTASRFPPRNPVLGWAHRRRRWRGDNPVRLTRRHRSNGELAPAECRGFSWGLSRGSGTPGVSGRAVVPQRGASRGRACSPPRRR